MASVDYPIEYWITPTSKRGASSQVTFDTSVLDREKLAEFLDIKGIAKFNGQFDVIPWRDNGWRLSGEITAEITQICVISLEPMVSIIREAVERTFLPKVDEQEDEEIINIDPDAPDPPEELVNGCIDLAAIACEQLALAIDPYPRKKGSIFKEQSEDPLLQEEKSPFSILVNLKKDMSKK